jgi:photosystem II stability/assembly factor-like uncharacterized protein
VKIANLRQLTSVIALFLLSLLVASCSTGAGNTGVDWSDTWFRRNTGLTTTAVNVLAITPLTPTILYAGTYGGVFKSTNNGENWSAANTGLTDTNVYALAIDPLTPTTLYVGTLDFTRASEGVVTGGAFKSTDGGAHWSATGLTNTGVHVLVIDPVTPTTLYARGNGVFKSTDGGANWKAVNTGLPTTGVSALAIDPVTPSTVYATGGNSGVFKSTDGGANWSAIGIGLPESSVSDLAIDPTTPTTLYATIGDFGNQGGVFKSTDGGANWNAVNRGLTQLNASVLVIDPTTPTTLYVAINDDGMRSGGVFKSTNGGANWSEVKGRFDIKPSGAEALAIDPASPATLYAGDAYGVWVIWQNPHTAERDAPGWLLPLVFCLLPVALVWATVWGLRRLSMRGFQSAIEMGGITCLKTHDGSVIFRRSSGYTWLKIPIFGVLELALLAFTVLVVTMGNWTLSLLVGLLIGCFLIGLALFFAIRSLRQPYIYINANSRTLERGTRQIPFSGISNIRATPRTKSVGRTVYDLAGEIIVGSSDLNKTRIDIHVVLNDGEVIGLGSVSGNAANSVLTRATTITKLVAEVTGAAIREPISR